MSGAQAPPATAVMAYAGVLEKSAGKAKGCEIHSLLKMSRPWGLPRRTFMKLSGGRKIKPACCSGKLSRRSPAGDAGDAVRVDCLRLQVFRQTLGPEGGECGFELFLHAAGFFIQRQVFMVDRINPPAAVRRRQMPPFRH